MKKLEYPRMVLQSDVEPAVRSWVDAAQRERSKASEEIQMQLMTRTRPAGLHESNGMAKNAVRRVEGIARTVEATLERILKITVAPQSPISQWVVRRGVFLLTGWP